MKNKKGFTLIELLVVITIIGIISVIALPGVQQLQARNQVRKFEAYSDTIESAGKLYTDSYSDDMFGMQGNGCKDIPYYELRGKSLIRDYETEGISCNNDKTFVQVRRENGKYTYKVSLKCVRDGKVAFESEPVTPCADTGIPTDPEAPVIETTYTNDADSQDGVWSKSKNITIKASAVNGLIDNISIQYGWSTDPTVRPATMTSHNFRNDYGASNVSYTFSDNSGKNGNWYLFVEADDVIDDGGNVAADKWSSVMKFDNQAPTVPTINNPKHNAWAGTAYVDADNYKITVSSSDSHGGVSYWKYKFLTTGTSKTYNDSNNTLVMGPFKDAMNQDIQVTVCDNANNCASNTERIKIDRENPTCSITLDGVMGPDGWYVSNVEVKLNRNDTGGAGVASYDVTTSSTPSYNNVGSKVQSTVFDGVIYYGYVKDAGGNIGSCQTEKFVVIANPPNISFSLSGSTSTATCYDGNTGDYIGKWTKSIGNSTHTVTCTDQYGLSRTCSQSYKATESCGADYSCACTGCCGTCTSGWCYCCCGMCGTSCSTSYSKSGSMSCS